jgi:hypothetical protein
MVMAAKAASIKTLVMIRFIANLLLILIGYFWIEYG